MENDEVADILVKYQEGQTKMYDIFLSHLSDQNLKDEILLHCLKGLKNCAALLGKEFELLVGVVLKINWLEREISVIRAYQGFLINLLSAQTDYLRACLRMIVRNFMPVVAKPEVALVVTPENRQKHKENFLHLHSLLQRVHKIVPMTQSVLVPTLKDLFPYMSRDSYIQACYVQNLLHLVQYMPEQRVKVLELIIDKMLLLDVRSPRQQLEDGDDSDDDMDVIFDMESDVTGTTDLSQRDSCMAEGRPMSHKEGDRLDVMMELVFIYIQNTCNAQGELEWEATKKLYRDLLVVFDKIILPTHASCHVQFLMFYICHFKLPLVEGFLDYLWKKVCNPNVQAVFRQAATAYMASLLARADYIPISTVKISLQILVSWTQRYIKQTSDTGTKADIAHHGPFYSVCQALFYVFVFKHKELLAMEDGYKYCQGLNFQTIVTCRLNPLKVCLPIVARTFSSVARQHQLAYCDGILERNRRLTLPEAETGHAQHSKLTHLNPLDSFFPFDPYLLKRSGRFVHSMYVEFDGSVEEESEHVKEDYDSDGETSDHTLSKKLTIGSNFSAQEMATSPTSLIMYGISPGFKHI